ncbi:hypothetical protein ACU6RQ_08065 [Zobellella denitrificans]
MTSTNLHTLVHIGAGAGNQLAEYQRLKLQKLVLIEPLPTQAEELRRLTANMPNAEVWELAVSCQGNNQPATLTEYNLADYSSLHLAENLSTFYPGIKVTGQHKVATLTPSALLEQLQFPKDEQHRLVLEAPGEEIAIILALVQQKQLHTFSQLQMSLPAQPLFQSNNNPVQLEKLLLQEGFELSGKHNDDPDISIQIWKLNPLKPLIDVLNEQVEEQNCTISQLQQQLTEIQKQYQELQQQHRQASETLANTEQELAKYRSYFSNRKKQHEAAEQRITELNQTLADANAQLATLREQLQNQQHSTGKLSELEQKMEQLFASQAEQLHQSTNALGQHVTKMHAGSNRQWQATLAVQHSLNHGEFPLQFGDASITPELAQQLVRLVQRNRYDLVIEFGSGTSTLLLAKALLSQTRTWQQNSTAITQQGKGDNKPVLPSEHDLPKRIISFEHDKNYYQQTLRDVKHQGLNEMVDLVHTPLVDYTDPSEPALFYDCKNKLEQLASLFNGQEKHILVLVDGPSASSKQMSRTPALPMLLNHLARHKLDVVLDDYHREGEQNSAEQWRLQLAQRSLGFTEQEWAGDKSALLLSINS